MLRIIRIGSAERSVTANLVRSFFHNLGVLVVGFGVAFAGKRLDALLGIPSIGSVPTTVAGALLLVAGFLVRAWATLYFYEHRMRVISLEPRATLLTTGPYRFLRNALYLGGNVGICFGAALVLGSTVALVGTVMHLPLVDLFLRREERQLEAQFDEVWVRYRSRVRRWI